MDVTGGLADKLPAMAATMTANLQAAGVAIEDHAQPIVEAELAKIFAGLRQTEQPVLDQLAAANKTLAGAADTLAQFAGDVRQLIAQGIRISVVPNSIKDSQ